MKKIFLGTLIALLPFWLSAAALGGQLEIDAAEDEVLCFDGIMSNSTVKTPIDIVVEGYLDGSSSPDVTETVSLTTPNAMYSRPDYFNSFNYLKKVIIKYEGTISPLKCYYFLEACEQSAITLASFDAESGNHEIKIAWSTESEMDNAGFNLYRSESENGEYIKINDALIPAEGSPTQGASYTFTDDGLQNRKSYWYKLEDIDLNGKATMHGPVNATPRLLYRMFH